MRDLEEIGIIIVIILYTGSIFWYFLYNISILFQKKYIEHKR